MTSREWLSVSGARPIPIAYSRSVAMWYSYSYLLHVPGVSTVEIIFNSNVRLNNKLYPKFRCINFFKDILNDINFFNDILEKVNTTKRWI